MDLKDDPPGSESESSCISNGNNSNQGSSSVQVKKCTDCETTSTPVWRGGSAGPKTLCNACGIRYHRNQRAILGLNQGDKVEKLKKKRNHNIGIMKPSHTNICIPKIKFMRSGNRQIDKLEVEQAALLLMALSYGSVYS